MNPHHQTTKAGQITSPFSGSNNFWESVRGSFRRMSARQQLLSLDDRLLRDIGIDRSDIGAGRF